MRSPTRTLRALGLLAICQCLAMPAFATELAVAPFGETHFSGDPALGSTSVINVEPLVEKRLIGWTEYNTVTCVVKDVGKWAVLKAPAYGSLRYAIVRAPLAGGSCAGKVMPFNVAYYTWKNTTGPAVTDTFTLRWYTADGLFSDTSYWTAQKQRVTYKELGTNFGWDGFTNPKLPAKSVGVGFGDTVYGEIRPTPLFGKTKFVSASTARVTANPQVAQSANQTVTLKGVAKGAAQIQAKNTRNGVIVGRLNAAAYNQQKKTVAVTLVHEKASAAGDPGYTSTDISDAEIKAMLQKVYKQAVIQWTITRRPAVTAEFDLNKDGKLDVESWMSAEMAVIRDAAKSAHDKNIFIVSKPTDGSCGFMSFNQRYGYIHADTCGTARTVAHELGHGQGLQHTPADTINIMYNYASTSKWRLRKGQWDQLNP